MTIFIFFRAPQSKVKLDTSRISTSNTELIESETADSVDDNASVNNNSQEKRTILSVEHLKALLAYVSVIFCKKIRTLKIWFLCIHYF